ncbi:hypothetical protein ACT3TZ_05995 [Brachybacterium sp. AOP25-B2-12]|uniref:hypothetical protein n=1 Tax=Brachybacterium sp. AOP25-B2-12 TaxID=3457710 RepID=UPI0040347671
MPLPLGTDALTLAVGEEVQVALTAVRPGVGEAWGVVSVDPPDVATAQVVHGAAVTGQDAPEAGRRPLVGGPVATAVAVQALAPGTATVRILFCYRSAIEEGCDQGQAYGLDPVDPVLITVTVR